MKCRNCSKEALPGITRCQKCKDVASLANKKYAAKNKEAIAKRNSGYKDQKRKYYLDNKEKLLAVYKEKYAANREEKIRYQKEYYLANKEKVLEYHIRHTVDKKEQRAERNKIFRDNNVEVLRARRQQYYAANKEQVNERNKRWYEGNKERCSIVVRAYRLNNPDKVYSFKFNRRTRERAAFVENVDRSKIFDRDGYICQLCGTGVLPFVDPRHPLYPTIDHIVPLAKGGTHEPSNVQTAHSGCNSSKGSRTHKGVNYVAIY